MSSIHQPSQMLSSSSISDLPDMVSSVEKDLLLEIIENMKYRKLTIGEAHKLAKEFLSLLPANDKEDLLRKLSTLGQNYEEARDVYAKYVAPHEEEKRQNLLNQMREHLKSGNIEQAIAVAKTGK